MLDGNGSEAQKSELLKVLALVGLSLEDLNNDPEVRELVSEVLKNSAMRVALTIQLLSICV